MSEGVKVHKWPWPLGPQVDALIEKPVAEGDLKQDQELPGKSSKTAVPPGQRQGHKYGQSACQILGHERPVVRGEVESNRYERIHGIELRGVAERRKVAAGGPDPACSPGKGPIPSEKREQCEPELLGESSRHDCSILNGPARFGQKEKAMSSKWPGPEAGEILIKVGRPAPDFSAEAYQAGKMSRVGLRDFQGKWVCLFFYPLDFTLVCPTEIRAFAAREAEFREHGCQIVGASTDSTFAHKAWYERDLPEVKFPVLADSTHAVSRSYGVLVEEEGIALRGTFLIDPKGVLQWMSVNALGVGRSVDEVLRTLQALQTGELCGAEWRPGKPTIKA